MTEDEADYVLAQLSVAFPSKTLSVPEVHLWVEKLSPYAFDDGMAAVKRIMDTAKFWPSWAEFRGTLKAVKGPDMYVLEDPKNEPVSREDSIKRIKAMRSQLKDV
jgi:hypothetical protein